MAGIRGKKKKKPLIGSNSMIGIFIIVLMVGSGMGLMLGRSPSSTNAAEYNGYTFKRDGAYWSTDYNGNKISFRYLPSSVENISIQKSTTNTIKSSQGFFITFDPDDTHIESLEVARLQMERTFGQKLGKYVGVGVTQNTSSYNKFPKITCSNATSKIPVIYMKSSSDTNIDFADNCLKINFASPAEVFALKDRLIYSVTGIIKNG
ncbi:MAG: hypothetical protein ACQESF_02225 [Nanobdellota archaeon]